MSKDLFALNQTPVGKKPVGQYEIDWGNPLTKGLLTCAFVINGKAHDYVSSNFDSGGTNVSRKADGEVGEYLYSTGDDSIESTVRLLDSKRFDGTIPYTIISRFMVDSGSANERAICGQRGPEIYRGAWRIIRSLSNTIRFLNYSTSFNWVTPHDVEIPGKNGNTTDWTDDDWHIFGISHDGESVSNVAFYHDGVNSYNVAASFDAIWDDGAGLTFLGDVRDIESHKGGVEFLFTFDRELSAHEHKSIADDPYKILKPATSLQESVYAALYPIPAATAGLLQVDTLNGLFALNQTPIGKKPIGNYEIDFSNDLTKHLIVDFIADGYFYSRGAYKTYEVIGATKQADSYSFDGINDKVVLPDNLSPTNSVFTIHIEFYIDDLAETTRILDTSSNDTGNYGVTATKFGDGNFSIVYGDGGYEGAVDRRSFLIDHSEFTLGRNVVTAKVYSTLGAAILLNGRQVSYTTSGTGGLISGGVGSATIGALLNESTWYYGKNRVSRVLLLDTDIAYSRLVDLHRDPYQFLKPVSALQDSVYAALYPIPAATAGLLQVDTLNGLFALNQTPIGKKPVGDYVIDWSNPLTNRLQHCWIFPGSNTDIVTNTQYELRKALPQDVYKGEISSHFSENNLRIDKNLTIVDNDFTIVVRFKADLSGNTTRIFGQETTDFFFWTQSGEIGLSLIGVTGTSTAFTDTEDWHTCVFKRIGNVFHGWIDGVEMLGNTIRGSNTNTEGFSIGSDVGYSSSFTGNISIISMWDTSNIPMETLNQDPYQILKPASSLQDALYIAVQSALSPIAVDDYYTATSGTRLVVPAVTGILLNDTYTT